MAPLAQKKGLLPSVRARDDIDTFHGGKLHHGRHDLSPQGRMTAITYGGRFKPLVEKYLCSSILHAQ